MMYSEAPLHPKPSVAGEGQAEGSAAESSSVRKTVSANERVVEAVREVLAGAFPQGLRSVVLTGSLARGEGTWSQEVGRTRLVGDAEFLVVFEQQAPFPSAQQLALVDREIEEHLYAAAIDAKIGLSALRPGYLRSLRPHIFAYELLEHGRVIWGDMRILSLAPGFAIADIPLEDGFRLLVNRIIELLEAVCESESPRSISDAVRYRAMKLWLDMATSFLLFQGQYESTYRRRAERLAQITLRAEARDNGSIDAPIPLSRFNEQVSLATDYKLGKADRIAGLAARRRAGGEDELAGLINDAHSLWRWELTRLTGESRCASDDELLNRWIAAQDVLARMRGWAAVAKRHRASASVPLLPRWTRLALKGSPRRLIYAVASQLFFALPANLPGGASVDPRPFVALRSAGQALASPWSGGGSEWGRLARKLPVMNELEGAGSWRSAGRAVAWNYRRFLEPTRS